MSEPSKLLGVGLGKNLGERRLMECLPLSEEAVVGSASAKHRALVVGETLDSNCL